LLRAAEPNRTVGHADFERAKDAELEHGAGERTSGTVITLSAS
jgi:hypothetical protein